MMSEKRRIYRYESIGSTNDEAKRLAELGEADGTLIVADEQTAGRGRAGRSWTTPRGAAIAMTLILRPSDPLFDLGQISLLGGLAVAEGIERVTGLSAQVKWPNDVLVRGRKTAGVLAEAAFDGNRLAWAVLGMGVNVNAGPPADLKLEYPATCLADEWGRPLDREALMSAIISSFDAWYGGAQMDRAALTAAWSQRLAMRGRAVCVIGAKQTITGVLEGITGGGAIVLRLPSGEARTIVAGEVRLRLAAEESGTALASNEPPE